MRGTTHQHARRNAQHCPTVGSTHIRKRRRSRKRCDLENKTADLRHGCFVYFVYGLNAHILMPPRIPLIEAHPQLPVNEQLNPYAGPFKELSRKPTSKIEFDDSPKITEVIKSSSAGNGQGQLPETWGLLRYRTKIVELVPCTCDSVIDARPKGSQPQCTSDEGLEVLAASTPHIMVRVSMMGVLAGALLGEDSRQ